MHAGTARLLASRGVESYSTIVHGAGIGGLGAGECAQAAAEGMTLGLYSFEKYKSNSKDLSINAVNVVEFDQSKLDDISQGIDRGTVIAGAVNLAREMGNEPANHMTPTRMAEIALDVSRDAGRI